MNANEDVGVGLEVHSAITRADEGKAEISQVSIRGFTFQQVIMLSALRKDIAATVSLAKATSPRPRMPRV